MRALKDPLLQQMIAGMFLLVGVVLCVVFGPELLARTLRTDFRIEEFWTEEAALEAGMWFVIGVACIVCSWQIFARAGNQ
jgi:hypothetical protein